jgi:FKBP-type peptidyl-prolyl cis-trans isomerase
MAKRIVFVIIALLFLFTSLGFSVLVIWQMHKDSQQNKAANTQQTTATTKPQEGKLEGTKLTNFTPVNDVNSLQKIDQKEGTGAEVKPGDTVTVHYTGAVAATGVIFQSSLDSGQPVAFPLAQVIKGWTDGIPGMKVGGVRRLVIPADQAYGATPPAGSGIPANAPLVFDVQLLKIGQ